MFQQALERFGENYEQFIEEPIDPILHYSALCDVIGTDMAIIKDYFVLHTLINDYNKLKLIYTQLFLSADLYDKKIHLGTILINKKIFNDLFELLYIL